MAADKTIILIGPTCSGKTSAAEIISEKLTIPLMRKPVMRKKFRMKLRKEMGLVVSISIEAI